MLNLQPSFICKFCYVNTRVITVSREIIDNCAAFFNILCNYTQFYQFRNPWRFTLCLCYSTVMNGNLVSPEHGNSTISTRTYQLHSGQQKNYHSIIRQHFDSSISVWSRGKPVIYRAHLSLKSWWMKNNQLFSTLGSTQCLCTHSLFLSWM